MCHRIGEMNARVRKEVKMTLSEEQEKKRRKEASNEDKGSEGERRWDKVIAEINESEVSKEDGVEEEDRGREEKKKRMKP